MATRTKVRGLDQLLDDFRELPAAIEKHVATAALRAGAQVYVAAMKRQVSTLPISASGKRKLRRAIIARPLRMRRLARGSVAFGVRIKRGRAGTKGQKRTKEAKAIELPFWWYFLEHGTQERYRTLAFHFDYLSKDVNRGEVWDARAGKFRRATTYRTGRIRTIVDRKAHTGKITATPFIRVAIAGAHESARQAIEAAAKKRFAQGVIQRASRRAT